MRRAGRVVIVVVVLDEVGEGGVGGGVVILEAALLSDRVGIGSPVGRSLMGVGPVSGAEVVSVMLWEVVVNARSRRGVCGFDDKNRNRRKREGVGELMLIAVSRAEAELHVLDTAIIQEARLRKAKVQEAHIQLKMTERKKNRNKITIERY